MSNYSRETSAKTAINAQAVADAFEAGIDEARDNYLADTTPEHWAAYEHAIEQWRVAQRRAHAAKQMADAIAMAEHLTEAWERCRNLPVALHAVPTTKAGLPVVDPGLRLGSHLDSLSVQ